MVKKLSASVFLFIGMTLMGMSLLPIIRRVLGVDSTINMPLFTLCMFAIGGLMAGLTGMILLARRQAAMPASQVNDVSPNNKAIWIHGCGLLLFTGIPFANFLACFLLWVSYRSQSAELNVHGINALNFQITLYLYLLLSLFLVFIFFGLLSTPLLLLFHLICTLVACVQAWRGKQFIYPTNIPIIKN